MLPVDRRRGISPKFVKLLHNLRGLFYPVLTQPAPMQKLYGLDHLRALAIIMVFAFHYGRLFESPQWVTDVSKFSWTGVDLFFVLSGYLISSQLFARIAGTGSISFGDFFVKRFFRIIPPFLCVLALYFLFPSFREREAPAPLWKYLTFTQNLGLDLRYQGTFSHAWSLCIEEQFYFCLPLSLMALIYSRTFRKAGWLLLLLFVCGFAARLYAWHVLVHPFSGGDEFWVYWYKWLYYPTYSRLDGLLTGVTIAAMLQFRPRLRDKLLPYGNCFLAAGLAVLTAAYFICDDEASFAASISGFPVTDLGYGLVVLAAVSPSCILYRFGSRVTAQIAAFSYALYLVHKITIHLTQVHITGVAKDGNLMLLLCMVTSVTGAIVLRFLVEKPSLRLRKYILSRNITP